MHWNNCNANSQIGQQLLRGPTSWGYRVYGQESAKTQILELAKGAPWRSQNSLSQGVTWCVLFRKIEKFRVHLA